MRMYGATVNPSRRGSASSGTRSWCRAARGALACIVGAVGLAAAQEWYPAASLRSAEAYKGASVRGYRIIGIERSLADELADGLALQGRRRFLLRRRTILSVAALEDDLRRAALFLARHGYPHPRLDPRIEPDAKGKSVAIVLEIDPGRRLRIGEVVQDGFPASDRSLPRIEPGTPVIDARVDTAAVVLRDVLRAEGFAFAGVRAMLEPMDSTRVRVRFVADPGPRYRWGGISVSGTSDDLARLVRKVALVPAGATFSPRAVRQIEERLRMLDLFRRVQVEPAARPDTAGVLDLVVTLADLDPRTVEAGLGLRTDEGLSARAGWRHRNLLKGGRGLLTRAKYGSHLRSVTAMLWFPGLLRADLRQELKVGAEWQREDNYRLDRYELELGTRYHRSLRLTGQAGVRERLASYRQITADGGRGAVDDEVTSLLFVGIGFDGADDILDPRRGWVTSIDAEGTIPLIRSDTRYAVVRASMSHYWPMWGGVAATRICAGRAWPLGGVVDVPPDVWFYAGGSTSMRGFARRKLGPLDAEGNPLGGNALIEAGLELRVPVIRPFVLAGFADAGQVWRDVARARLDQIEVALGAGVRVVTPVGHIRFDVARRITEIVPDQPMTAYHLAVGEAF